MEPVEQNLYTYLGTIAQNVFKDGLVSENITFFKGPVGSPPVIFIYFFKPVNMDFDNLE